LLQGRGQLEGLFAARGFAMYLKAIVIWVLLAIIVVAVLGRLVHNAKVADRALKIAKPDHQPHGRKNDKAP
jgi:hypothetical protein